MRKLEKLRYIAFGVIITLAISSTVSTVSAAAVTKQLQAVFNSIKVIMDGKDVETLKDAKGNPLEAFTVDGTVYVPAEAMSKALGKAYEWDASANTAYLGVKNTNDIVLNRTSTILGINTSFTLSVISGPANIKDLKLEWKSSNPAAAAVDANGKITARAVGPANITLTDSDGTVRATCAVSVVAYLGRDIKATRTENRTAAEYPESGSFSIGGESYSNGLTANYNWSAKFIVYYELNQKYTHLSGVYGAVYGYKGLSSKELEYRGGTVYRSTGTSIIRIYGDNKLLRELTSDVDEYAKAFNTDIKGVSELRIEFHNEDGSNGHALANMIVANNTVNIAPTRPAYMSKDVIRLGTDIRPYRLSSSGSNAKEYPFSGTLRIDGKEYTSGISSEDSFSRAYLQLDGQFKTMSGLYGALSAGGTRGDIRIFGDGKLLNEYVSIPGAGVKSLNVNVTGVKQLIIEIAPQSGSSSHAVADVLFRK